MDTSHIPVQRLTALLETFTLKHAARMLPDLLETADLQDSSCREFLLAVLETEVKGRNERRRKRNYSAAHFPPNIRPLDDYSGAAEPPVRQSQSHSSDGTEPP